MDLDAALAARVDSLVRLDPAEVHFMAARGDVDADQLANATDASLADDGAHGAAERLGLYIEATALDRFRHWGRGSRRRSFIVRQMRERRLADRVRGTADCLHHTPVEACGDIVPKIAAVIAAGEAGPPDATAFPWSLLRRLLADVVGLTHPAG